MSVIEFRVALTTEDFDRAVKFFAEGIGLIPGETWSDGGQGQMFDAGKATLEVFNEGQAAGVDHLEVGQRVSGQIRFAFQVPDVKEAVKRALEHGATLVSDPILTPWGDFNARVQSPDGLQVTLYQVMSK